MQTINLSETQRRYLEQFTAAYVRKTAASQARREAAWPALADGRSSQGYAQGSRGDLRDYWLRTKQLRHPIVAERAQDAYVWDLDGNRYVDFCLGFGVHLFGHRPPFLDEALRRQLERGLPIGFQSDRANEVATAITAMTGAERVAFCNTGAEAIMGAVRLARAATQRDTVVVFSHSYHGSHDAVLPAIEMSYGLPKSHAQDTLVLEYGAPRSLEQIAERAGTIAAVIIEPVQARRLSVQPAPFLQALRQLTREKDIVLIFDEILLGFRIHQGGLQAHFGLRADLATYGKILGGGLPIGVIGGSAHLLDRIDGGRFSHHDDSAPATDKIWFAGTFTKNPLTMAAAQAVTTRLAEAGNDLQSTLNAKTAQLVERLNGWLSAESMPAKFEHFGSMFRIVVPPELWIVIAHLRERGVYLFDGMAFFLSTAHGDAELLHLEEAVRDSFVTMRRGGYIA
jgi:glutamate-1-semialdehyde aminotransferase